MKEIEGICWGFYKNGSPGVCLLRLVIGKIPLVPGGGGGVVVGKSKLEKIKSPMKEVICVLLVESFHTLPYSIKVFIHHLLKLYNELEKFFCVQSIVFYFQLVSTNFLKFCLRGMLQPTQRKTLWMQSERF